eukprot:3063122-Pyramimonas_sp.AAC.1
MHISFATSEFQDNDLWPARKPAPPHSAPRRGDVVVWGWCDDGPVLRWWHGRVEAWCRGGGGVVVLRWWRWVMWKGWCGVGGVKVV